LYRLEFRQHDKGRTNIVDQQTKAALKHDQFVDVTTHGLTWASENRRSVIVTSALLLGVIVAAVIGFVIYNSRSEKASVAFGGGMAVYQTPIAFPGQPVPVEVKTFSSIADRARAANSIFKSAADTYSMTPDGKNARYFEGLTYMEAGENASAEATLKQVAGFWNSDLAALGKLALAQLYRQTGRAPQAIELYNQLTAKPTTSVPAGTAQLQLAELYNSQGNADAAKKIYAQLKDKDPKSAAATIANGKLNPAPAQPLMPQQ
jgi:tetratricopeptide (TPR) repeat protein